MYVKTSDKTSCEEAQYCITWPVDLNDEWRSSVLLCASGSLPLTQSVFPTFDSQVQEYLVCKQERERVCVFVWVSMIDIQMNKFPVTIRHIYECVGRMDE